MTPFDWVAVSLLICGLILALGFYNTLSTDDLRSIAIKDDCFEVVTKQDKEILLCGSTAQLRGFVW